MNLFRLPALLVAPLLSLACATVLAQSATVPGVSPNPTPDKAGPNAVDCAKATNKRLPDCSADASANRGAARPSSGTADRGIQAPEPPRTNNGMSGPMSAPRPPGDIVEGKKDSTTVPR
jgi:hypothetical protein